MQGWLDVIEGDRVANAGVLSLTVLAIWAAAGLACLLAAELRGRRAAAGEAAPATGGRS